MRFCIVCQMLIPDRRGRVTCGGLCAKENERRLRRRREHRRRMRRRAEIREMRRAQAWGQRIVDKHKKKQREYYIAWRDALSPEQKEKMRERKRGYTRRTALAWQILKQLGLRIDSKTLEISHAT